MAGADVVESHITSQAHLKKEKHGYDLAGWVCYNQNYDPTFNERRQRKTDAAVQCLGLHCRLIHFLARLARRDDVA